MEDSGGAICGDWLAGGALVLLIGFFVFGELAELVLALIPTRTRASGKEGMIGRPVEAKTALNPKGKAIYEGRLWNAEVIEGEAAAGETLRIVEIRGLRLMVERASAEEFDFPGGWRYKGNAHTEESKQCRKH